MVVPEEVSHFRPISLCNVTYKIISKIMVNKLKLLMAKLISPYQNAFIQGRNIFDNILLAHEIIDTLKKKTDRKKGYGALKVDMCKSYDRVSWNFLKTILISMSFGNYWVHRIMECVSSMQYALLLNGSPTHTFLPTRGVRQGDPISLYLFLLCANILSIALIQTEDQKKIKGIKLGRNGVSFTHLFYADDSLFFFENDRQSLRNLKDIILWYSSFLGQNINFTKSDLFRSPNILSSIQESLANALQVNLVQNPCRYLGLNFKLRGRRVADFEDLVEILQARFQGWSAKLLSQAGRATLISLVL